MQEVGKQQRWSIGLSAVLLALGAAGCPGTVDPSLWPTLAGSAGAGSPGTGGAGVPACDPAPIFRAKVCAAAACHDANGTAANFDMASDGWQTRLVAVNPKGAGLNPSMCAANGPYLVAGMQPATGLFLDKLKPNTTPACGVVDAADRREADRGRLRVRAELGERARDGRPEPDRRRRRERG